MQNLLIGIQHFNYKSSTEYKYKIADESAGANAGNVNIVMTVPVFQNMFGEQHSAPAKPERYLHRIQGAHHYPKPETVNAAGQ
jgi:hypothetical protein